MRTPIMTIICLLKLIIDMLSKIPSGTPYKHEMTRYSKLIMSQLEFLQSFVEDLLDLRMLESGKFTLTREPFDIVEIVKNICNIFRPQVSYKDLQIEAEVQGTPITSDSTKVRSMPTLLGDGRHFKQILINLVKNAIKFTEVGTI